MKILILGATGLIGNNIFKILSKNNNLEVYGTYRNDKFLSFFNEFEKRNLLFFDIDRSNIDDFLNKNRPDIVINLIAITKHVKEANNFSRVIQVNSMFPHFLAKVCDEYSSKLIQISTDCVFSGLKGSYLESDLPDDSTMYGKSKALGEVTYGNLLTIRTSAIGRELDTKYGLVEWFLSQEKSCLGYSNAIFSGLTARYLGHIMQKYIFPLKNLSGLFHISANPINKFDLLNLLATAYGKDIPIARDDSLTIDRSLDSSRFRLATGYRPQTWPELVSRMREFA
jgi:dTDP-4-dehydrorhamnose reductase